MAGHKLYWRYTVATWKELEKGAPCWHVPVHKYMGRFNQAGLIPRYKLRCLILVVQ